jgi:signal-transduction protein with cAMP-binding, CBS, and nucleotidyltransferase domain
MTHRPISQVIAERKFVAVTTHSTVREVARLMKKNHTCAVLVIDRREDLVGICTERDVVLNVVATRRDPDHVKVTEIMTRDPQSISVTKPFGHALHMMYEGGFHHLPVVDAHHHPVGILSARDALAVDAVEFEHELIQREEIAVIL